MSPNEPSRTAADALDMAKLQKSLKQQQRHSRPVIKKLTPAEIRSLNYEATAGKQPPNTSKQRVRSSSNGTAQFPLHSNDRYGQLPRSSTAPLPTPSRSPVEKDSERRSRHDRHHNHHGRKSRSATANYPATHGPSSRASSVSSYHSGQSLQTYRGHEVTQTGGQTMLHRPKQEIVTNPLSMFSRPRQSQLQAETSPDKFTPDKFTRDFLELDPYQAQAMLDGESDDGVSAERKLSDVHGSESLASKEHPPRETPEPSEASVKTKKHVAAAESSEPPSPAPNTATDVTVTPAGLSKANAEPDTPRPLQAQPNDDGRHTSDDVAEQNAVPAQAGPSSYVARTRAAVASRAIDPSHELEPVSPLLAQVTEQQSVTPHKKPENNESRKRFSFHHVFDRRVDDKGTSEKSGAQPRKQRRRTLSFTKTPETSPKPLAQSFQASEEKKGAVESVSQMPSHPAVRPISPETEPPPSRKIDKLTSLAPLTVPSTGPSSHTYGRCACCGKIKKQGYSSELSPVLENENIRSNFSFEAERNSHEVRRKYTPIIPMAVAAMDDAGSVRTVQATIEPKSPQTSMTGASTPRTSMDSRYANDRNNSSVSLSTAPSIADGAQREVITRSSKRNTMDEPKVVRFGSLHGRRGSESDVGAMLDDDDESEEIVRSVPFVQPVKHAPRPILGPSEQEIQRQRAMQAKSAVMGPSSAGTKAPHPLRQSLDIDQQSDHSDHSSVALQDAQQQDFKRVPKQDIITVLPITRQLQETEPSRPEEFATPAVSTAAPPIADAEPAEEKPVSTTADATASEKPVSTTADATASTPTDAKPPKPAPKKLQKQQTADPSYPPSSFPTSPTKKSRRFSLPQVFRSSKRASTPTTTSTSGSSSPIGVPYASATAGAAPDTDPSHKPALPSQASTARTSLASELGEDKETKTGIKGATSKDTPLSRMVGVGSRSASREATTNRLSSPTGADEVADGMATGDASAVVNGADEPHGGKSAAPSSDGVINGAAPEADKTVRPSPSFAKFISNLPASHAADKDVPEVKRSFGMGIIGGGRRSLQQQPVPTIAEDAPLQANGAVPVAAPKIALNGSTIVKGQGSDPTVNGIGNGNASLAGSQGGMTQSISLPAMMKLGEEAGKDEYLAGGSGALGNNQEGAVMVASPVEMSKKDAPAGGFGKVGDYNDENDVKSPSGMMTRSSSGFVGGRKLQMMLRGGNVP